VEGRSRLCLVQLFSLGSNRLDWVLSLSLALPTLFLAIRFSSYLQHLRFSHLINSRRCYLRLCSTLSTFIILLSSDSLSISTIPYNTQHNHDTTHISTSTSIIDLAMLLLLIIRRHRPHSNRVCRVIVSVHSFLTLVSRVRACRVFVLVVRGCVCVHASLASWGTDSFSGHLLSLVYDAGLCSFLVFFRAD